MIFAGRILAVAALFGLLSVIHTWPLADTPARVLHQDRDVLSAVWSLHELARQVLRDPAHLMDGNIFYPYRDTLASLDHQLTQAVLATPLVAGGANGAQIYNLIVLTSFALSGVFAYALIRRLTGSTAAALIGGTAYAFSGYRATHLNQVHLLATQWLPLALLALHAFLERPSFARWLGLAGAALLLALASWHMAVIGAVGIGIVAAWTLAARSTGLARRVTGLLAVAILCGLALLPLARAYARMGEQWPPRTSGGRETVETLADLSASAGSLVTPALNVRAPYARWLADATGADLGVFPGVVVVLLLIPALGLLRSRHPGTGSGRRALRTAVGLSAGLVAVGVLGSLLAPLRSITDWLRPAAPVVWLGVSLAAAGLIAVRRLAPQDERRRWLLTYLALAVAGALFALGPRVMVNGVDLGSGLWRLDLLPVRLIMRAPERLSLLLVLGTAVLAGFGVARLLSGRSLRTRATVTVLLLVLLNADLAFRSPPLLAVPGPAPIDNWLAEVPEEGAVIDYPLLWTNRWAVYKSQAYDRRIVNGTGYLLPPEYLLMESLPDLSREQLEVVWEYFHPRFVVIRSSVYTPDERMRVMAAVAAQPDSLALRARFGTDFVYELTDRGRANELIRRWPIGALWNASTLTFRATVSQGRDDATGRVAVSLNGTPLAVEPTGVAGEHRVSFGRQDLVPGANAFEIAAGYDFLQPDAGRLVGTTGLSLPADVAVVSDRQRAIIEINGRRLRPDRGYRLVALDPRTGRITATGQFDTSSDPAAGAALAAFIDAVPDGTPVVVATEFDVSRALSDVAVQALAQLGLREDLRDRFQAMHAAIGVKGAAPGTALEATDRVSARLTLGELDYRIVQLDGLEVR